MQISETGFGFLFWSLATFLFIENIEKLRFAKPSCPERNQSSSGRSNPVQRGQGHMVRPPLHRPPNCSRKRCTPVHNTCMQHAYACSALHCTMLYAALCIILLGVLRTTTTSCCLTWHCHHRVSLQVEEEEEPEGPTCRISRSLARPTAGCRRRWPLLTAPRCSTIPSTGECPLSPIRFQLFRLYACGHDDARVIRAVEHCIRVRPYRMCVRTCVHHRSCASSSWDPSTPQLWIFQIDSGGTCPFQRLVIAFSFSLLVLIRRRGYSRRYSLGRDNSHVVS